jgi:hypothetical protein
VIINLLAISAGVLSKSASVNSEVFEHLKPKMAEIEAGLV